MSPPPVATNLQVMTDSFTPGSSPADRVTSTSTGVGSEWPAKAADIVELVVDTIHDKAIRPLVLVARVVVFGLLVSVVTVVVLALVAIGVVRLLDVYAFGGRVWISYFAIGAVFTLGGLAAWSRRSARHPVGQQS